MSKPSSPFSPPTAEIVGLWRRIDLWRTPGYKQPVVSTPAFRVGNSRRLSQHGRRSPRRNSGELTNRRSAIECRPNHRRARSHCGRLNARSPRQFAGAALELHQATLEHIRNLFAKRNRVMRENNRRQAMFPRDSRIIPNAFGTAPGIEAHWKTPEHTCRIFSLPGVPVELKRMWSSDVAPALTQTWNHLEPIRHFTFHCFGAAESEIESRLPA